MYEAKKGSFNKNFKFENDNESESDEFEDEDDINKKRIVFYAIWMDRKESPVAAQL